MASKKDKKEEEQEEEEVVIPALWENWTVAELKKELKKLGVEDKSLPKLKNDLLKQLTQEREKLQKKQVDTGEKLKELLKDRIHDIRKLFQNRSTSTPKKQR